VAEETPARQGTMTTEYVPQGGVFDENQRRFSLSKTTQRRMKK
jgi:hypothetical protein